MTVAGISPQRRIDINLPNAARPVKRFLSHDDKFVYALLIALRNEIGVSAPMVAAGEQLTADGKTHRLNIYPSPDGKIPRSYRQTRPLVVA